MALIRTSSGKTIDLFNLQPEDIELADIIKALPNICRYGGRINTHYSVAQHSCELAKWLFTHNEADLVPLALLHDACEAYIGDMIYPIKIKIPEFEEIESKLMYTIFDAFDVNYNRFDAFNYYDKNIVVNEMKALDLYEADKDLPTVKDLQELQDLTIIPYSINNVRREYKSLLKVIFNGQYKD